MKKEMIFKSNTKTIVEIDGTYIRISRKGIMNFMLQGMKGEKTIPIKNITAIQLKKNGLMPGYIQFSQHGMVESKKGMFDATKDENSIIFSTKGDYEQAVELKAYIESIQAQLEQPAATMIVESKSEADELLKFKQLLDAGAINQEEYEHKKKQILGL
jgi:Domain of unknown function (DUF4429)/Short C-terminal domain